MRHSLFIGSAGGGGGESLIDQCDCLNINQYIVLTVKSAVSYVSAKSSDGNVAERTHPLAV